MTHPDTDRVTSEVRFSTLFFSWSQYGIAGRTPDRERVEGVPVWTQFLGGDV